MLDETRPRDDLARFAERCLSIRGKSGACLPLRFNPTQRLLDAEAARQVSGTGRVRIIALKARQLGFSTYVQARFYHRTTHAPGQRAYILTHAAAATANLFSIARRFQASCPASIRPRLAALTATAITFADQDSSYRVGTARTGAIGRSDTIQLFHGSEVAFWPRPEERFRRCRLRTAAKSGWSRRPAVSAVCSIANASRQSKAARRSASYSCPGS
jgi:hypothetical protein